MKLLSLFSVLMISGSLAQAVGDDNFEGAGDAGGGDAYALEFTLIGQQAIEIVRDANVPEVSARDFAEAVSSVRIISEETLHLFGAEVDAINYPSLDTIKLSRNRWDAIEDDVERRYKLVVHEYLSVMGLQDSQYQLTNKIFLKKSVPVLQIVCTDGGPKSSERINLNIRLFKNTAPVIAFRKLKLSAGVPSKPPGTLEKPIGGVYSGVATNLVSKDQRISISFFVNSKLNYMVPLKFKAPVGGNIIPDTDLHSLAVTADGVSFVHGTHPMLCNKIAK